MGCSRLVGLADEIGSDSGFAFGMVEAVFFAELEAFEQPGHVAAEGAHGLETLQILADFVRGAAMHHVPILGGNDGHIVHGEIFVELVKGGCCTAAAAAHDGGAGFVGEILTAGTEAAV